MRIQPGDILYIKRGEKIPADCMLISTDYDDGSCFIETADLDGETNLKRKAGLLEMAQMNTDEVRLILFLIKIHSNFRL